MPPKRTRAPGGGRKRLDGDKPAEKHTVTVTAAQWAKAKRLGDGVGSRGVQRALDEAKG